MLDFLMPKTKVQAYNFREVPIETFEVIGIAQINPYCSSHYENETFLTVVNFANGSKNYDEKESLILAKYFTMRRCINCGKNELIPINIKINLHNLYLKNEEEIAFDAYSEYPSRINTPSIVKAYCNNCNSCFEIRIKTKDLWVKEAKAIKERNLIAPWQEYKLSLK